ncbi:MAG TPA: carbamoyltransferase [Polyangia bacterium]|nr:carbamoyltransferase [Polyangia bacterium]
MWILGVSAFYHDAAACLVQDGRIVAAAQEERFTRKRHDHRWPASAIAFCLKQAGIEARELDVVAFYDKPMLKFERLLSTYAASAPWGLRSFWRAMPLWLKQKLWIPDLIRKELPGFDKQILFPEHHESHAASAFYPSPFDEAAILTVDGVGEWTTTSLGVGRGNKIELNQEIQFPHSLGLLYSAFTYYTGFKVNSGEYKVMGLAPYGEPKYADVIYDKLIDLRDDGSFRLDLDYFDYCAGLTMTNKRFDRLFGAPPRAPESPLSQREMDLAASVQAVCEEAMIRLARHAHDKTGMKNLCLAGGVALNCVANGRLLREAPFEKIWVQPAAGDAGGAVGAALIAWYDAHDKPRDPGGRDAMSAAYLGPEFSDDDVEAFLQAEGVPYHPLDDRARTTASLLAEGGVVGWFQGRMEFGPRALGARSILGDARSTTMQSTMNLKIKFRESFRPFAPSVLREKCGDYFELDADSPYMLMTAPVRASLRRAETDAERAKWGIERLNVPRSTIPAVTHVDYSARVQTVTRENGAYYDLLRAFDAETGCAVVVNTSFNVRGEPIVCTPADAYKCFMRTEMDHLILGRHHLKKSEQPALVDDEDWRARHELD